MKEHLRILVAGDASVSQKKLKHNLETHGFEAVVYNDGLEAKETIDQNQVDLIIADYMM